VPVRNGIDQSFPQCLDGIFVHTNAIQPDDFHRMSSVVIEKGNPEHPQTLTVMTLGEIRPQGGYLDF